MTRIWEVTDGWKVENRYLAVIAVFAFEADAKDYARKCSRTTMKISGGGADSDFYVQKSDGSTGWILYRNGKRQRVTV